MAVHENTTNDVSATQKPLDPRSLDFIERISYFENLGKADNDNAGSQPIKKDAACFNSWAIPDFLRG
jgi:hypothetical protein